MANAAQLLGSARRYRGVSGRALARSAKASQPGLGDIEHGRADATTERLDKFLRQLGYSLTALPTRRGTVADAAEQVRVFSQAERPDAALRVVWQLAADLSTPDLALRVALCVAPPASTGSARLDALLAAVAEHALAGLPRPAWLDEPWRTLSDAWDVEPVPALRDAARAATPPEIAQHGVFLDAAELVNV